MRKMLKLFKNNSVLCDGVRGSGKDVLFGNVAMRLKHDYVSNLSYGPGFLPFDYSKINLAGNTYKDFISGKIKRYVFPYDDGTHFFLSDAGIYFPSQYCNELNRDYKEMSEFQALVRHLTGTGQFHVNSQFYKRVFDKIREQSETFINCRWCVFIGPIVFQRVRIYERQESFEKRVPPFSLRKPLLNPDRRFQWEIQKSNYLIAHGEINSRLLIYWNRSKHNTRHFKEVLENGI